MFWKTRRRGHEGVSPYFFLRFHSTLNHRKGGGGRKEERLETMDHHHRLEFFSSISDSDNRAFETKASQRSLVKEFLLPKQNLISTSANLLNCKVVAGDSIYCLLEELVVRGRIRRDIKRRVIRFRQPNCCSASGCSLSIAGN